MKIQSRNLVFLSLVALSSASAQKIELKNLFAKAIDDSIRLIMEFDGEPPEYKTFTDENGIFGLTLIDTYKKKKFEPFLFSPIQHIQVTPFNEKGIEGLFVLVYPEKEIKFQDRASGTSIEAAFYWRPPPEPSPTSKIKLKKLIVDVKEEHSLSAVLSFNTLPVKRHVFQTLDKKQVIMVFPHAKAEKGLVSKFKSQLITSVEVKKYTSLSGDPIVKLIYNSPQELIIDVAEESNQLFLEFYGMGRMGIERISNQEVESKSEYAQYKPRKGISPWYYMGFAGALISGAATAYHFLINDDREKDTSDDVIPPPTIKFPNDK